MTLAGIGPGEGGGCTHPLVPLRAGLAGTRGQGCRDDAHGTRRFWYAPRVTRETFEELVEDGMKRIPEQFRRYLRDIAVVVEDEPSSAQRNVARLQKGSDLLGLYEGTPRTERQYLPFRYPEKITIFQRPFERLCGGNADCIREEVASTVWHELAHALGFSERQIRQHERKRGARHARPRSHN